MKVKYTRRMGQNKAKSVVEVSETEGEWMVSRGFAELVGYDEGGELPSGTKGSNGPETVLSLKELQERAEELGLATYGTKAQLQQRIKEAE